MKTGWISGEKIMERYGKLAVEIGQACYDGILHPFTETLIPVVEESKLGHIPKYPPAGVNPRNHILYTHSPNWDWTEQLKLDLEDTDDDQREVLPILWTGMIASVVFIHFISIVVELLIYGFKKKVIRLPIFLSGKALGKYSRHHSAGLTELLAFFRNARAALRGQVGDDFQHQRDVCLVAHEASFSFHIRQPALHESF